MAMNSTAAAEVSAGDVPFWTSGSEGVCRCPESVEKSLRHRHTGTEFLCAPVDPPPL